MERGPTEATVLLWYAWAVALTLWFPSPRHLLPSRLPLDSANNVRASNGVSVLLRSAKPVSPNCVRDLGLAYQLCTPTPACVCS